VLHIAIISPLLHDGVSDDKVYESFDAASVVTYHEVWSLLAARSRGAETTSSIPFVCPKIVTELHNHHNIRLMNACGEYNVGRKGYKSLHWSHNLDLCGGDVVTEHIFTSLLLNALHSPDIVLFWEAVLRIPLCDDKTNLGMFHSRLMFIRCPVDAILQKISVYFSNVFYSSGSVVIALLRVSYPHVVIAPSPSTILDISDVIVCFE
jgi:hypothetical protein